ncbi:MAG: cation-transporting P-type ATPase [Gammaproteobacteria bacterium]
MATDDPVNRAWHALEVDAAFRVLASSSEGLTSVTAGERLERQGANRLPSPPRRTAFARLGAQFNNILIYVLIASAAVTAALREWADVGVILAVVVINAVIGFVQEGKAEHELDAIVGMLPRRATVRRDGRYAEIDATALVPGDVIELVAGDKVPADARLFQCRNLRVDEGLLTGESMPVEKSTEAVAESAEPGARRGMVHSGTLVTYGRGAGVVVATGTHTEIGLISSLLRSVETLQTPFVRQMARFGRWLSLVIVVLAGATVAFGILVKHLPPMEMFLAGVGLAVAAIPEGLPAVVTIALAVGVRRMARRKAIIRQLPAVETLGAVGVICSDKTGTLTRNEMTVRSAITAEGLYEVGGVGYTPHGEFSRDGVEVAAGEDALLEEMARAGILCNDARVIDGGEGLRFEGDPTEIALLVMGSKAGHDPRLECEEFPRDDVIPFESERRFMASRHHDHAGHVFIVVKGAPEQVLEMCAHQRGAGEDVPLDTAYWHGEMHRLARRGERLLALAFRASSQSTALSLEEVTGGLTLLGIVGMLDPPREEAIEAVEQCRAAGIRVKMITGDHAVTASEIGRQLGIGDGERVLTGREIDALDDAALGEALGEVDVFARASPEHKLRLVKALQSQGWIVAMTGDGVNDAPALKRANIGIAMGARGTDAAREAAPMVLADDNFATIVDAVREGRTVYDNLKKTIMFILPTDGAEGLVVIAAIVLGTALPITPLQILWVNTITAVTLALPLAFEASEPGVMGRPPRNTRRGLLTPLLIWRIAFVAVLGLAGTFGLFAWERSHGAGLAEARTVAVNTLVLIEMFYLLNTRFLTAPVLNRRGILGNPYVLIVIGLLMLAQFGFVYGEPLHELFGTGAISLGAWLRSIGVGCVVMLLVEIEKYLVRRFRGGYR